MKKIVILTIVILSGICCFAQTKKAIYAQPVSSIEGTRSYPGVARTTAIGDTLLLSNINPLDTLTIYRVGAGDTDGYATGTNSWNDIAFAERYNITGQDSSVMVLGVVAEFAGKVNPASVKTITLTLWDDQGSSQMISSTTSYNGFPGNILDTVSVSIKNIGIGTTMDTLKHFLFATPAQSLGSFFAGYSINYGFSALDGDTIGLACSKNGHRMGDSFTVKQVITDFGDTLYDTLINVQNATLEADNAWYDNFTQNDSLYNNLAIFPLVAILPSDVKGITRNNLTFFGNYPNPANANTNIKFSLAENTGITVQIMDMNGRVLNSIKQDNLAAGAHIVPVNTANMPFGDYLYLVRTSGGDGIAGKMTVIH